VRELINVGCVDLIDISKAAHGDKHGMKLLSADVGDRMMYLFFGFQDAKDQKYKTVLYPINMDDLSQHKHHIFN